MTEQSQWFFRTPKKRELYWFISRKPLPSILKKWTSDRWSDNLIKDDGNYDHLLHAFFNAEDGCVWSLKGGQGQYISSDKQELLVPINDELRKAIYRLRLLLNDGTTISISKGAYIWKGILVDIGDGRTVESASPTDRTDIEVSNTVKPFLLPTVMASFVISCFILIGFRTTRPTDRLSFLVSQNDQMNQVVLDIQTEAGESLHKHSEFIEDRNLDCGTERLNRTTSLSKEGRACMFVERDGLFYVDLSSRCGPLLSETFVSVAGKVFDDIQWHRRIVADEQESGWLVARNSRNQFLGSLDNWIGCTRSFTVLHPGHFLDLVAVGDWIYVAGYLNDDDLGIYRPFLMRLSKGNLIGRTVQIAPLDPHSHQRRDRLMKDVEVVDPDRYLAFQRVSLLDRFDIRFRELTRGGIWVELFHGSGTILVGFDHSLNLKSWSVVSGSVKDEHAKQDLLHKAQFRYWLNERRSWGDLVELRRDVTTDIVLQ